MSQIVSTDSEEIEENLSDYLLFVGIQTHTVIILYITIYANTSSTFFGFYKVVMRDM